MPSLEIGMDNRRSIECYSSLYQIFVVRYDRKTKSFVVSFPSVSHFLRNTNVIIFFIETFQLC